MWGPCTSFLAAMLLAAASAVTVEPERPPTTLPWDTNLRSNAGFDVNLPLTDSRLQQNVTGLSPEQVHVTYWSDSSVLLSFAAGQGQTGLGIAAPSGAGLVPTVQWGTVPGNYTANATGVITTYVSVYEGLPQSINYASPLLCHVILTGISRGKTYYYQVGFPSLSTWSPELTLRTPAATFPFKILAFSDAAQTLNTTVVLERLARRSFDLILYPGDFTYADYYLTQGLLAGYVVGVSMPFQPSTYQPRWDSWGRLMQPLFSRIAMLGVAGNHELEPTNEGVNFQAYNKRFPNPTGSDSVEDLDFTPITTSKANSTNNMYYSVDVPGIAHIVFLQSYIPGDVFNSSNPQFLWLKEDLAKVNRSSTPWLIVSWHFPMYTEDQSSYAGNECFRQLFEPVLYEYGVDLAITSHIHGYERTKPIYNYTVDPCGPVHITVGNGGAPILYPYNTAAPQWMYQLVARNATPAWCANPYSRTFGSQQPQACWPWIVNSTAGYCGTARQAPWSAFKSYSFGYGSLVLNNETHAQWYMNRNQDAPNQYRDQVAIIRNTCSLERRRATLRRYV